MEVVDFGVKDYGEALKFQEALFFNLIEEKRKGKEGKEYILIGEHLPVITLGRRAKDGNILISDELLKKKGIDLYHIGRGGDVTYHCPGQMIVYPILDLERHHLGVKDFVNLMEESIIRLLDKYGIKGDRIEGATGVWIGKGTTNERKICAMGIKCSRYCTMHGLALNVTADLEGFTMINPCGFQDKGVTSIKNEISVQKGESKIGVEFTMDRVKKDFLDIFLSLVFSL